VSHDKVLVKSSLTLVVVMCHFPIGETFNKVSFHMATHEWFFCESGDYHMSNSPSSR